MGYRSEVVIVMRKKDYNTMKKRALVLKNKSMIEIIEKAETYTAGPKETLRIIRWNWIKWYPEYPEIKWIEKFLNDKDYIFYRIGEDISDVVEVCSGEYEDLWDCAYLDRSVVIEGNLILNKEE